MFNSILPEVKECLEDLRTGCGEDGTWISYMRVMSDYEVNCAPSTGKWKRICMTEYTVLATHNGNKCTCISM